jgi:hypothetical protein
MSKKIFVILFYGLLFLCPSAMGQSTSPVIKEELVSRPIKAVNYKVLGGSTTIDFKGTELLPGAGGEAKVESKQGFTRVNAKFRDLPLATKFGAEYLTYVLWSVSTDVSYMAAGASKAALGTVKVEAETKVSVEERLVNFAPLKITESNFSTLPREQTSEVVSEISKAIPKEERVIVLDYCDAAGPGRPFYGLRNRRRPRRLHSYR